MIDLCVIGLGYVGLPTAAVFADSGLRVHGIDRDAQRLDAIRRGEFGIEEPGLVSLLDEVITTDRLTLSTSLVDAEVYVIAVPTPVTPEYGYDESYVLDAGRSISPNLKDGNLVILESTVPPTSTEKLMDFIQNERSCQGLPPVENLRVAHCPERVLPGRILHELKYNDRIVGGVDTESTRAASDFYRRICSGEVVSTDARTAELAKIGENAYRDVNIAFANELSRIAEEAGVDDGELIQIMNRHPRVQVLSPSAGVGGHCIPVDPWFLISGYPSLTPLMRKAREINDAKTEICIRRLQEKLSSNHCERILLLGLSYKPDSGDTRNSSALEIAVELANSFPDKKFYVEEPYIKDIPPELEVLSNTFLARDVTFERHPDTTILLVKHSEFFEYGLQKYGPRLIDYSGNPINVESARGSL